MRKFEGSVAARQLPDLCRVPASQHLPLHFLLMPASYPATAVLLPQALPQPHYVDTYHLPRPTPLAACAAAQVLFGPDAAPAWVRWLMRLRNALAPWLGLRATLAPTVSPARLCPGGQLGPFRVYAVSPTEVLLGLDDRHLDFRVAVLTAEPQALALTTAVRFHNRAGRVYFAGIAPFHRAVVRALLRRSQPRLQALSAHLFPHE